MFRHVDFDLVVYARQRLRLVSLPQIFIPLPIVQSPEFVFSVVCVRIQRLSSAKLLQLTLQSPVLLEVCDLVLRSRSPKSYVHHRFRLLVLVVGHSDERVETWQFSLAQWTHPQRPHVHFLCGVINEGLSSWIWQCKVMHCESENLGTAVAVESPIDQASMHQVVQ